MTTMEQEVVISVADLRYVCIKCQHCNTQVILDMADPSEVARKYANAFTPASCPGCQSEYDSAIRPGIDSLQRAYMELLKIEKQIAFRGKFTADTSPQ